MGNVTLSTATIPAGYCFQGLSTDWPFLVSLLSAQMAGTVNTFNFGSSTPSADNRGKPWLRLGIDGSPDRFYTFWNGFWVAKHPLPAGFIQLYDGTGSINTFDGGETEAIGPLSGPMWERVTQLDARFPVGVGTLPSGTALSVTATGGEEKHTLLTAEMPKHRHDFGAGDFPKSLAGVISGKEGDINQTGSLDYKALLPLQETGGDQPHNTMPPYYTVYFLRRTARLYYRV